MRHRLPIQDAQTCCRHTSRIESSATPQRLSPASRQATLAGKYETRTHDVTRKPLFSQEPAKRLDLLAHWLRSEKKPFPGIPRYFQIARFCPVSSKETEGYLGFIFLAFPLSTRCFAQKVGTTFRERTRWAIKGISWKKASGYENIPRASTAASLSVILPSSIRRTASGRKLWSHAGPSRKPPCRRHKRTDLLPILGRTLLALKPATPVTRNFAERAGYPQTLAATTYRRDAAAGHSSRPRPDGCRCDPVRGTSDAATQFKSQLKP